MRVSGRERSTRRRRAARPRRARRRHRPPRRGEGRARRAARRSSRRCASAARRTCSRRPTTRFELRGLVRFARSRELPLTLLGRGSNVVISDRGVRGLVVHVRAEGSRIDGTHVRRRGRRADGARRHGDAEGRPDRAGVRAGDPGQRRRRGLGERRRARLGRQADPRVGRRAARRRQRGAPPGRPSSASSTARAGSSTSPPMGPPRSSSGARFRLEPASRPRSRRASTTSGTGARPTSRSASRRPAAPSGTRRTGPSAGALIEAAGLKGLQEGGATVSEKHANFIVNDRKGTAADVRRLVDRVRATILETSGVDLVPEIVFVGDWDGWPWPAEEGARRMSETGTATRRSSSCSAGRRPSTTSRVVSGTAIAEALAAAGLDVRQVLIDLDGAGGGCPPITAATGAPQRPTTTRPRSAPRARSPSGAAIDRLAAGQPAPVVFIALHGPFGEDGTVQALLEAAGLAYTGAGVAASALGHGQGRPEADLARPGPAGHRLDRGPRRQPGRRIAPPCSTQLEAFAAGSPGADPRLMVKPARLGSSVGMTLAHTADERAAALELAFRYDDLAIVERYLAERPRPGGLGHRQRGAARRLRARRDRRGPRVLRLRGEVHAGPVGDVDPRRGAGRDPRADDASSPATPIGRSARRASRASTSWSAATRSTSPRSTRSRASRRSACSRRCPPRPASTSPRSACASSTSPSSATPRRARPPAHAGATCPGEGLRLGGVAGARPARGPMKADAAAGPAPARGRGARARQTRGLVGAGARAARRRRRARAVAAALRNRGPARHAGARRRRSSACSRPASCSPSSPARRRSR